MLFFVYVVCYPFRSAHLAHITVVYKTAPQTYSRLTASSQSRSMLKPLRVISTRALIQLSIHQTRGLRLTAELLRVWRVIDTMTLLSVSCPSFSSFPPLLFISMLTSIYVLMTSLLWLIPRGVEPTHHVSLVTVSSISFHGDIETDTDLLPVIWL